jgi:ligand-binding sensor domain-containing protein
MIYERFTTEDGLVANQVQGVLQLCNGYLWIGTEDGLAR